MAHPYEGSRNQKERSRVGKLYGGECRIQRARGGSVKKRGHGGAMRYAEEDPGFDKQGGQAKKFIADAKHLNGVKGLKDGGMGGKKPKHRLDKRARGGRAHSDEAEDRALIKKMVKSEDLKERARGGRTKKGGHTSIHINVAPPHGAGGDLGSVVPGGAPPGMAGAPPPPPPGASAGPPGGGPMPPPMMGGGMSGPPPGGGGPPMLPPPGMRAKGGRVHAGAQRPVKTAKIPSSPKPGNAAAQRGVGAQGPGDKSPGEAPGWKSSERNKTPVQHTDGKKDGSRLLGPNMLHTGGDRIQAGSGGIGKKTYDDYEGYR